MLLPLLLLTTTWRRPLRGCSWKMRPTGSAAARILPKLPAGRKEVVFIALLPAE
jgi:hypothetical protein